MRRIDHRIELADTKHAEVGYREGATAELRLGQATTACPLGQFGNLGSNREHALGFRVADDRSDQSTVDGDRHAQMHTAELFYSRLGEMHVGFGNFLQGHRHGAQQEVID
ncbi:hypothetical protein D9M71_440300 [compost metagenome]